MARSKSVVEPVTLTLPFPPKELSPNARTNRWVKARVVRQYRQDCGWLGRWARSPNHASELGRYPLTPPVEATVTFVVPDRRKRDLDNLLAMLKPAWDGLVDAGVLAGDDASQFKVADTRVLWDKGMPAKVIVSLSGAGTT